MANHHFGDTLYVDHKNSSDVFLLALLELMQEKAYADISVSELCHKAGLSRNTFYKFFFEKDALLDYLREDITLGFIEYKKVIAAKNLSSQMEAFVHYFSFWYQLREWVDVLVKNNLWDQIAMPKEQAFALLSARNWDHYLVDTPHALEMMQTFLAAGCIHLVKWWSLNGFEKTPTEMAELVVYTLSGQALNTKKIDSFSSN